MAFAKIDNLVPYGGPILRREIVANDVVMTQLDSVKIDTDGFIALGTAGVSVFGHVMSMANADGVGHSTDGTSGAALGSFLGTFTHTSSNETVAFDIAEIDVSQFSMYSATPATGTFGTTTGGSGELGAKFDLTDEDDINETSITVGTAQYFSHGLNPDGTNTVIVNIFESQLFNDSQT